MSEFATRVAIKFPVPTLCLLRRMALEAPDDCAQAPGKSDIRHRSSLPFKKLRLKHPHPHVRCEVDGRVGFEGNASCRSKPKTGAMIVPERARWIRAKIALEMFLLCSMSRLMARIGPCGSAPVRGAVRSFA